MIQFNLTLVKTQDKPGHPDHRMTKEGTRSLCGEIDHHLMILGTLEVDLDISHIFSTCLDLMYIMTISHFLFHYFIKAFANVPLLFEYYKEETSGLSKCKGSFLFNNLFYFLLRLFRRNFHFSFMYRINHIHADCSCRRAYV